VARLEFENLPEQHERRNDRGRLEVHSDLAVAVVKRRREYPRQYGGDERIAERDADAECDQREHVEVARADRLYAAHEERPAAPGHDRCGQQQLHPVGRARRQQAGQRIAGEHLAHRVHEQRQGQRHADPEPAPHVVELGRVRLAGDR